MSELIPFADQENDRQARLHEFIGQWELEDIPACDEGMALLMAFAETHPGAYRLAFTRGLYGDPHPMVKNIRKWHAYAEHVSTCPKCNER